MKDAKKGDGDPLDICVLSERPITRAEVIINARVVGGLPMLDGGEADDKIIGVLENDPVWSDVDDLPDLPTTLIDRLRHYFLTYKLAPEHGHEVFIGEAYDRKHAEIVIQAAIEDYDEGFGKG
jgi:inorganic pyrophosphatase